MRREKRSSPQRAAYNDYSHHRMPTALRVSFGLRDHSDRSELGPEANCRSFSLFETPRGRRMEAVVMLIGRRMELWSVSSSNRPLGPTRMSLGIALPAEIHRARTIGHHRSSALCATSSVMLPFLLMAPAQIQSMVSLQFSGIRSIFSRRAPGYDDRCDTYMSQPAGQWLHCTGTLGT